MPRHRVAYGARTSQHGDLWLPAASPPVGTGHPVVVLLHGGFWKAIYSKRLMTALAFDVTDRGWAAWNLEYRRVGSFAGGGWRAPFEDVAAGVDHLAAMAEAHRLDLTRVVTVGHSAGGHLALWAAARCKLPLDWPSSSPFALRGAVGLAPVSDLVEAARLNLGGGATQRLLGGPRERCPDRYAAASPAALLPFGVAQVLVHGTEDGNVPFDMSRHYVARAQAVGDDATLVAVPGTGHMDLIDPASEAWAATATHLTRLFD